MRVPHKFRAASLTDFGNEADPARELVARLAAVEPEVKMHYESIPGAGRSTIGQEFKVYDLRGVPGLVIVGGWGTGKTHMAAAIANDLDGAPFGKRFISALAVVEEAKDAVREGKEPRNYGRYKGLLILDDLSAIRPTDFALDTLSKVVRIRYDESLPTVVTTHAGHSDLAEMYGGAIASRLLEMGPIVKLKGEDRRRRMA